MGNVDSINSIKRKEPWLAVSLSWIIPGLGQFYTGNYFKAAIFFVMYLGFYIAGYVSLLSPDVSVMWMLGLWLFNLLAICFPSCFDAFISCKQFNLQLPQISESSGKDAWLGGFLSLLFPGLGHAYLRRKFLCAVYVLLYFAITYLPIIHTYAFLLLPGLRIISAVHAYLIVRRFDFSGIKAMIAPWSVIISSAALFWIILPLIISLYIFVGHTYTLGPSMFPTLHNNNEVIINKIAVRFSEPRIGDIVVFEYPVPKKYAEEHPEDKPPFFCKRIVAIGTEQVLVEGNDLYVNGKKRTFEIPDVNANEYSNNEVLKNNSGFYSDKNCGVRKPFTVPDNCYYVLGDNMSNSLDSRYFGPVPRKLIKGKVIKVYKPIREMRTLSTKWKDVNAKAD